MAPGCVMNSWLQSGSFSSKELFHQRTMSQLRNPDIASAPSQASEPATKVVRAGAIAFGGVSDSATASALPTYAGSIRTSSEMTVSSSHTDCMTVSSSQVFDMTAFGEANLNNVKTSTSVNRVAEAASKRAAVIVRVKNAATNAA